VKGRKVISTHLNDKAVLLPRTPNLHESDLRSGPVLVTGGAGFIGSHLVEFLLRQAQRVILIDVVNAETSSVREKRDTLQFLQRVADSTPGASMSVHNTDILDGKGVVDVLQTEKPRTCLHCAALVMDRRSIGSPGEFLHNNCLGTFSLLEALKATDTVRHLVYVSSRSVYGDQPVAEALGRVGEDHPLQPINMYGASKVAAEQVCYVHHRVHQLSVNVCRLFPVYGPRGRVDMFPRRLLERLLDGQTLEIYGDTSSMRDWLYVEDTVEGILRALWKPMGYEIINFGTGRATSLHDLIKLAEELTGKKASISFIPRPAGDARFVGVCDNRKAKALLQWEPTTELSLGLKKTLDFMLQVRHHQSA
jgi:UDP-glucuronate 4-epimerase